MVIRSHRAALLILSAVSFVWGAEFVLIDMAVEQMPVHTFNAFRFTLAGLSLIPLLILSKELIRPDQFWPLLQKGAILGFMLFVGFYAQTEGLRHTSVSNAGFITGLNVPLVPVLGFLIFRTKVARTVWLSVLLATVGLYMLTMGDKLEFNKGDLMVLVCAFAFAIHIVMTGRYVDHLPVVALSVVQLLAVGFYSIAGAVLSSEPAFYYLEAQPMTWVDQLIDPLIIAAILVAGLLGTAFAYWGQSACQKVLPDYKVALVFATEPVFAYITAWLVLSETLGFIGILGAIGIIAGMLVAELGDRRHPLEVQVLDQTVAPK